MKIPLAISGLVALMPLRAWAQTAPIVVPDAARISLDDLGLYAAGYAYRGKDKERFPIGWSENFEKRTGVSLLPQGQQNGRKSFLLHPPWRGGTGTAFQEFRFQLPALGTTRKITLSGATAMRSDALAAPGSSPKSDGVTFRVWANGQPLLDEPRADANWKPFTFDLSSFAGKTLTLRFETDPGPNDNSAFDFALWGDRELRLEGFAPKPLAHPAPPPLDLRRLLSTQNRGVAPPSGFEGKITTSASANGATLGYSGADGTLQYRWTRPRTPTDPPLGTWQLRARQHGAISADTLSLAGDARLEWTKTAKFLGSKMVKAPDGATCVSIFEVGGRTATLRISAHLSGKSLVLDTSCDAPELESFGAGRWGPALRRRAITVPYYSGQVFYLSKENLFVNAFLDWTNSSASSHDNTVAVYGARTDGSRVPMRERAVFCAAWHAAETFPNVPNPPSPFRAELGKRMVLDVWWGGRFNDIVAELQTLHDYGIDNCLVLIHVWQHQGYDNGLPGHVPANARMGGEPDMKQLVATAKGLGYRVALHENYVDYYPNYERFDPDDIALESNGKRVLAWYNESTKMQSFGIALGAMLKLARQQSTQIRARYAPDADYLDVHSAVPPWFHNDYRATSKDAGMFRPVWQAHRDLWAFERANYGGPVLGEGNNHWYWSGLLDGVEAQFGSGWPNNQGQNAPLSVDFDLLKIHPLQFNHGMGYYERWWANSTTWSGVPPMAILDQYRMQEIIYGHAAFLGASTWNNVPLAWLEHHLVTPITTRLATAKPIAISYQVGGRWVDATQAIKAGRSTRTRVSYNNGLSITANDNAAPLRVGDVVLPQHGWVATGAGVSAWTATVDGTVADYARTQASTFANARRASDWNASRFHRVQPTISDFKQTGPRTFSLSYNWRVEETLKSDLSCFVHFVDSAGGIKFQDDHALARPTSTWKTGETVLDGPRQLRVPDNLADGQYSVRIGLIQASGRFPLQGHEDGGTRIILGTLSVREGGSQLAFAPDSTPDAAIYDQRLNARAKVLDFGDIRTNGSVLVQREGADWVLRALPRAGDFTLELSSARFGHPASVRAVDSSTSTVSTQITGKWWTLRLNGAREYRWK